MWNWSVKSDNRRARGNACKCRTFVTTILVFLTGPNTNLSRFNHGPFLTSLLRTWMGYSSENPTQGVRDTTHYYNLERKEDFEVGKNCQPKSVVDIYVIVWSKRMGPLACISPFTVTNVDKGHLLRLQVSKLPCCPLLFPNKSLTHELNNFYW